MEALERPSWNPARQCTGTNREGERCQRQPIPGGTVCVNHGGKAPQTIAAAKQRLLEGVEPAIARLLRFIEAPPGLCNTCGRCDDTGAIVGAIRTLLDRAGLGPHATMEVVQPHHEDLSALTLEELAQRAERIAKDCREAADCEAARLLPDATDAVRLLGDGVVEGAVVVDPDGREI